jgi:pimeloyl-ACP methyl ester carboxylesterase
MAGPRAQTGRPATIRASIWPGSRSACGGPRAWLPPIGYYRAAGFPDTPGASAAAATRYADEQQAADRRAPQPSLYLHGAADGCIKVELARGAEHLLAPSSRMVVIDEAGHFLHLEKPGEVNRQILAWVTG